MPALSRPLALTTLVTPTSLATTTTLAPQGLVRRPFPAAAAYSDAWHVTWELRFREEYVRRP